MNILPYNIALCPPAAVKKRAIEISKRLRKEGGLFSLGPKLFVPHVTIYMLDMPAKNEKNAVKILKMVARGAKQMRLHSLKYRRSGSGYTDVVYKKSKAALRFQMKVINAINPLREGITRDKYKSRLSGLPAGMRKNILAFGFSDVGKEYHPHITFTRFHKGNKKILKEMPKRDFSFTAREIGIYRRGEHGTCRKLIAKFRIGS